MDLIVLETGQVHHNLEILRCKHHCLKPSTAVWKNKVKLIITIGTSVFHNIGYESLISPVIAAQFNPQFAHISTSSADLKGYVNKKILFEICKKIVGRHHGILFFLHEWHWDWL